MPPSSLLATAASILLATALNSACQAQGPTAETSSFEHFENHIRPLLHARCVRCHGENQAKGNLRLDTREGLLKGGESGPAAISGEPENSLMMEAVRYESYEMPPDKQLPATSIDHLQKWIADGLPWPSHDGASVRLTGAAFTEEEKAFWSLQPIQHPTPPDVESPWARHPIDRFVYARLRNAGLTPAPAAAKSELRRRLHYALTGLPPTSNTNDTGFDFNEQIEALLQDPRYGEHWARHWLDIVRYAESDGFRADGYRDQAWRYRDYVVDAFNDDKPYNVFVMEQLAGDEIAPDRADALVATGYLRTYLYEYNQRDARTQWQDILNQVTDITGDAFLGMSVGCARCHDHKFDPILQEDYYRLRASFGTMLPRDDVPASDLVDRDRHQKQVADWLLKATDQRKYLLAVKQPYLDEKAKAAIERFPADIQAIMAKPAAERNAIETQLADLVQRQVIFEQGLAKFSQSDKEIIESLEKEIAEIAGAKPADLPKAITVADVGTRPFPLHIGQNEARRAVSAGGFSILNADPFELSPSTSSSGQRTALANWIVDPNNPLTARVLVNRIWQQHFGTGLVSTASDFGSLGGRPSHPELLDWLASEFVAHDWSIKWLHRIILTSNTWQMSAFHPDADAAEEIDPGNNLRWRFPIRRLTAEQIRDAMLMTSGELKSEIGGPGVEHDSLRRSLYLKILRNKPEPLLSSLDGVDGLNSVPRRSTTTTPTQALNLMNGKWVRLRAAAMAQRVLETTGSEAEGELTATAFRLALSRPPGEFEQEAGAKLIRDSGRSYEQQMRLKLFAALHETTGNALRIGEQGVSPPETQTLKPSAPFTFVSMMQLESLYPSANVRTLASAWDNQKTSNGWSIGVTSEKSAYQPRNLILQPIGQGGYEVVASNLRPELNTPYLVAVAIDQNKNGGRATFYLQALQTDTSLQTATVSFKSAIKLNGPYPMKLGGRFKSDSHNWNGLVDQTAVFDRCLSSDDVRRLFDQRLGTSAVRNLNPVAFWSFDDQKVPGQAEPDTHSLILKETPAASPLQHGVAELCHVLLNSNEFVYLD